MQLRSASDSEKALWRLSATNSALLGTRVAAQIMSEMIYFRLGALKKQIYCGISSPDLFQSDYYQRSTRAVACERKLDNADVVTSNGVFVCVCVCVW
jgi:hypothetical protein